MTKTQKSLHFCINVLIKCSHSSVGQLQSLAGQGVAMVPLLHLRAGWKEQHQAFPHLLDHSLHCVTEEWHQALPHLLDHSLHLMTEEWHQALPHLLDHRLHLVTETHIDLL